MKSGLILSAAGLVVLVAAGALGTVSEQDIVTQAGISVCTDIARQKSLRPSSLEVNDIEVLSTNLTLEESLSWLRESDKLSEVELDFLDLWYERDRSYKEIYTTIDHSSETRLGAARSKLNCKFIYHGSSLSLATVFDERQVISAADADRLFDMSLDRLNILWKVEQRPFIDRLRAVQHKLQTLI
ncbi:MAG: hypothetical protein R3332_00325 [Pseudohongiellaceae bacterium]|nr:hypothetical protein [Pseudohongiellaceae bacterium]